jgi:uncharacterized protein (DUF4415 family)
VNKPHTPPKLPASAGNLEDDVDLSDLGPDDAPELTPELAAQARTIFEIPEEAAFAEFIRKGGRPLLPEEVRKRRVTIMLDPDVIAHFKAGGRGWQTRINAALRKAAGL